MTCLHYQKKVLSYLYNTGCYFLSFLASDFTPFTGASLGISQDGCPVLNDGGQNVNSPCPPIFFAIFTPFYLLLNDDLLKINYIVMAFFCLAILGPYQDSGPLTEQVPGTHC